MGCANSVHTDIFFGALDWISCSRHCEMGRCPQRRRMSPDLGRARAEGVDSQGYFFLVNLGQCETMCCGLGVVGWIATKPALVEVAVGI